MRHRAISVISVLCVLSTGCGSAVGPAIGRASDSRRASASPGVPSPSDLHQSICALPAICPSARSAAGIAFDQERQAIVLFAGHSWGPGVSGTGVLDDTWE